MFTLIGLIATGISTLSTLAYFDKVNINKEVELPMNCGTLEVEFTKDRPLYLNIQR